MERGEGERGRDNGKGRVGEGEVNGETEEKGERERRRG